MTITKTNLNDALNNYISLPTKKRDVMSLSVQRTARQALREFSLRYPQDSYPTGTELLVMVKNWIAQSGWTTIKKHKIIRVFLAMMSDQYFVDKTAAMELTAKFKPHNKSNWSEKALTDEQLQILFRRMYERNNTYTNLRNTAAIAFMLYTGSRISAAISAHNYSLTADSLECYITRQKSRIVEDIPKAIPLDIVMPNGIPVRELMNKYVKERELRCTPGGWLFAQNYNVTGKHMNSAMIHKFIAELNLPFHFTPHSLRHTAGTIVAERVGVLEATRLLDHSSIAITQRYIKKYTGDSRDSIGKAWSAGSIPIGTISNAPTQEVSSAIKTIRNNVYSQQS